MLVRNVLTPCCVVLSDPMPLATELPTLMIWVRNSDIMNHIAVTMSRNTATVAKMYSTRNGRGYIGKFNVASFSFSSGRFQAGRRSQLASASSFS